MKENGKIRKKWKKQKSQKTKWEASPRLAPELTHCTSHDPPDLAQMGVPLKIAGWLISWKILWKSYENPMNQWMIWDDLGGSPMILDPFCPQAAARWIYDRCTTLCTPLTNSTTTTTLESLWQTFI
jgi:hypothetical protein